MLLQLALLLLGSAAWLCCVLALLLKAFPPTCCSRCTLPPSHPPIRITLGTWTGGGDRERYQEAWNSHIKCGIITRQGSSFILTDSKRDSTTHLASAGASTETEIAVSAYNAASHDGSTATYVKDVTLSAIDEYNQLICWTYGVSVPQCTCKCHRIPARVPPPQGAPPPSVTAPPPALGRRFHHRLKVAAC